MPGLYIHIPFCHQACYYCNFHFSTGSRGRHEMVEAIIRELEMRAFESSPLHFETIYLGGGTPSLLDISDLEILFEGILKNGYIESGAEITLEANPEDLYPEKLKAMKAFGINRLSIGIQSFNDEILKSLNRNHTSEIAIKSIENAQHAGFDNFTIDLIYGIPGLGDDEWKLELKKAFASGITHLSAYCLTVEKRTALDYLIQKGTLPAIDDQQGASQFEILMDESAGAGFEQYEISNFAKDQAIAIHNSSYWKGKPYIGLGPSAHSFDGKTRSWNIANNNAYLKGILTGQLNYESEVLSSRDHFNETIMTRLRTSVGLNVTELSKSFPDYFRQIIPVVEKLTNEGMLCTEAENIKLTRRGKLFADQVSSALFIAQ